jgi:UPF0716 protein FxsA
MPADAVVDGVLILAAGILLVTPGVLSDLFGVALLIPPLRSLIKRGSMAWLRRHVKVSARRFTADSGSHGSDRHGQSWQRDEIIEAKVIKTRVENAD